MEYVHIKLHILTFLPIHSIYRVNIGKRGILNKNIGIIGQFLKDRDFIGNIGTLIKAWKRELQDKLSINNNCLLNEANRKL